MLEILFLLINLAVRGWYCSSKNISDPIPMVAQPSSIPNFYLVVQSSCPNAIHCNSISSFRKEDMREERSHLKKFLHNICLGLRGQKLISGSQPYMKETEKCSLFRAARYRVYYSVKIK